MDGPFAVMKLLCGIPRTKESKFGGFCRFTDTFHAWAINSIPPNSTVLSIRIFQKQQKIKASCKIGNELMQDAHVAFYVTVYLIYPKIWSKQKYPIMTRSVSCSSIQKTMITGVAFGVVPEKNVSQMEVQTKGWNCDYQ